MKTNIAIVVTFFALGCTSLKQIQSVANAELAEESRALTTAVVDALELGPPGEQAALEFAKQDQCIEGLPVKPFDMPVLLGLKTNATPRAQAKAEKMKEDRFARQNELLAVSREATERLADLGAAAEAEGKKRRAFWLRWGLGGGTMIAVGIALVVLFPALLPIAGRVLAWMVGRVPRVAGALGVVSVQAFDAVVRGIEETRRASREGGGTASMSNQGKVEAEQTAEERLRLNLSRAMDAEHKKLVRSRKAALELV